MKSFAAILFVFAFATVALATQHHVPDDFNTIQAAIEQAEQGDTVLVQPGTYEENIDFLSKSITVGSLMLTTGDLAWRDSTILDGGHEGPCAWIEGVERDEAILNGFVVQHGEHSFGGGIHISESIATIANCLIRWNTAIDIGGGVASIDSDIYLNHCTIRENETDNAGGGGVYLSGGYSALLWCDISFNNTDITDGGGLYCTDTSPVLTNCTIAYNRVDQRGGGVFFTGDVRTTLRNTIFWGNEPQQMWLSGENWITVTYCDIQGGIDELVADHVDGYISFDEFNIDVTPGFVDRRNYDLHLAWDNFPEPDEGKSPCIDAGDPESRLDPDQTNADLGAYYFHQPPVLRCHTSDTLHFEPIQTGYSDWQCVCFENLGGGTINITSQEIIAENSPFSIGRGGGAREIPGRTEHETWVNFLPRRNGTFEAIFRAETDDENLPVVNILLYAYTLGIEDNDVAFPNSLHIDRIYPNPFNSSTTVGFTVLRPGLVNLEVLNVAGNVVRSLCDEQKSPGFYRYNFNGDELPAGIYFIRLSQHNKHHVRKLTLLR